MELFGDSWSNPGLGTRLFDEAGFASNGSSPSVLAYTVKGSAILHQKTIQQAAGKLANVSFSYESTN
jgi:hypothetical protein